MESSAHPDLASSSESADSLVRSLLLANDRQHLTARERRTLLSLGSQVLLPLIAVLRDESLEEPDGPSGGYARERAAALLGELRAVEAIDALLDVLRNSDVLSSTHDAVCNALAQFGMAAVEPVLSAFHSSTDAEHRVSLAGVLSRLRVSDPRILAALLEHLEEDRDHAAGCLADYGDAAALPPLLAALDAERVDPSAGPFGNQAIIELCAAIEELGGTLTAAQQAKEAQATELRERRMRQMMQRAQPPVANTTRQVGRNEPCPCGSGKKHKRCCGA